MLVGPSEFPSTCADVTMDGKPWPHGNANSPAAKANTGEVSSLTVVPRAEVFEFQLSKFDVDRHELKRNHKDAITDFTKRIKAGIQSRKYTNEPLRVFTYGETSTTASAGHNAVLSRNRAFNTLNAIRCAFKDAGITQPVYFGFYGTGEQHARFRGPDNLETPSFRGVVVRAFAPLAAAGPCKCPPGPKPPATGVEALCISVPTIGGRSSIGLPPGLIPLGPIVPGLKLPIAIVTKAQAGVRVEARRSRQTGQLTFNGWGIEVALPAGRARVDIQADLRASLEVLARASASLSGKLKLGPLGLTLRIDASAFAQLVVKLCAQLRLRLEVGLGRPNLPELTVCKPVEARNVKGAFPFGALAGPGILIVPDPVTVPRCSACAGPAWPGSGCRRIRSRCRPTRRRCARCSCSAARWPRQAPNARPKPNGPRPNGPRRSKRSRPRCRSSRFDGPDGTTLVPSGSGPNGTKSVPPVPGTAGTDDVPTSHLLQPFPL